MSRQTYWHGTEISVSMYLHDIHVLGQHSHHSHLFGTEDKTLDLELTLTCTTTQVCIVGYSVCMCAPSDSVPTCMLAAVRSALALYLHLQASLQYSYSYLQNISHFFSNLWTHHERMSYSHLFTEHLVYTIQVCEGLISLSGALPICIQQSSYHYVIRSKSKVC